MAVIKDNAYGHGAIEVARYLEPKVEYLCVAELTEALELREAGISCPILVFEIPPVGQEYAYRTHNIIASIADLSVFERLEAGTDCHLNFDTGMGRLGILPEDAGTAYQKMQEFSELNYSGIYTHFANSDEPNDSSVIHQVQVFSSIRSKFPDELMTHTCNSGGIFFYSDKGALFDAVRPGVCLYGYAPGKTEIPNLQPALTWKAELVRVRKVKKGDAVSYGSRWKAPHSGWLGTVPVGYSDGLFRNLSGKIKVEIAEKKYRQVGTISMDYCGIFLEDSIFGPGEQVTLLNKKELDARSWAEKIETIPYEVTTAIAPKVQRKYVRSLDED